MPSDIQTVVKGTMKTFLTFSSTYMWKVKTTEREKYTKGNRLKIETWIYGLKDGARLFYLIIKKELLQLGCKCVE